MAIPDFQTIMLPLLGILAADDELHTNEEFRLKIADHYTLTQAERQELVPSGRQTYLANRIGWALSHFKFAGIVSSPRRGYHQVTARGRQLFQQNPTRIDLKLLDQFPEHLAFRSREKTNSTDVDVSGGDAKHENATPEEAIRLAYQEYRESLAQELTETIKQSSPAFFERLVVDVLLAMGYGGSQRDAGEALGRAGDGGIDGVIREDKLGLDVIYLQAKRWEGVVGRPVIQAFVGAIHGARATKGVIITTSSFSAEAREYVKTIATRIVLVDGKTLAELMIDHGVAVSRVSNYELKKIDSDYFLES